MNYNFYTGEVLLIDKPHGWTSFDAVNRIKADERRQREALLEPEDAPERGRSPSRDKRKGKWRQSSDGSE
jgi:hypothetical protein